MAATWAWTGRYGTSPGTHIEMQPSGNVFNFKTLDSLTGAGDYTSYPITAGNNSYTVYLRGGFSGSFSVNNLQFWQSAGVDANVGIYWNGQTTAYTTPTTASMGSTVAPTADPGTANVSIGGSLTGALTATGYSDYIVLQMKTLTGASAGDTSTYTFTFQYDES